MVPSFVQVMRWSRATFVVGDVVKKSNMLLAFAFVNGTRNQSFAVTVCTIPQSDTADLFSSFFNIHVGLYIDLVQTAAIKPSEWYIVYIYSKSQHGNGLHTSKSWRHWRFFTFQPIALDYILLANKTWFGKLKGCLADPKSAKVSCWWQITVHQTADVLIQSSTYLNTPTMHKDDQIFVM